MGLFGKKKKDTNNEEIARGGGLVESVNPNSEELKDLLNEFREMRAGVRAGEQEEIDDDLDDEMIDGAEEYHVSEQESESIENFLSGNDIDEEVIEEESIDEEVVEDLEDEPVSDIVEEEVIEEQEEPIEETFNDELIEDDAEDSLEEVIEEEELVDEEPQVDVDVAISEYPVSEDEVDEEEVVEYQDDEDVEEDEDEVLPEEGLAEIIEEVEEEYPIEDEIEESDEVETPVAQDVVTSEEIDKKFDDFEKRLMEKLMQQFALMQASQVAPQEKTKAVKPIEDVERGDDDLEISTVRGKLVINDYKFMGEVVMFTPLDSLRKATWEEVVRRKGHCTYHLTTSGNGGWFIKKSNAPNPYAYIEKKEDAEELAKLYAKREKAELKIHNAKGVIEKSLSFGREKLRG